MTESLKLLAFHRTMIGDSFGKLVDLGYATSTRFRPSGPYAETNRKRAGKIVYHITDEGLAMERFLK